MRFPAGLACPIALAAPPQVEVGVAAEVAVEVVEVAASRSQVFLSWKRI
jgi:hypothetical protein